MTLKQEKNDLSINLSIKELGDLLDHRAEISNRKLINGFSKKLINAGLILSLVLPFLNKLANTLNTVETLGLFSIIAVAYVVKWLISLIA